MLSHKLSQLSCSYYWGFAAYIAYHINHPLYTPPGLLQTYVGLGLFVLCELGNFTIHVLLRNLRPAGSKERKIPYPNSNPLSQMQAWLQFLPENHFSYRFPFLSQKLAYNSFFFTWKK